MYLPNLVKFGRKIMKLILTATVPFKQSTEAVAGIKEVFTSTGIYEALTAPRSQFELCKSFNILNLK